MSGHVLCPIRSSSATPGRCMALADADFALASQRVTLELLLAAERVRQNGAEAGYVADRVMEAMIMACLISIAQDSARMRPQRMTRRTTPAVTPGMAQRYRAHPITRRARCLPSMRHHPVACAVRSALAVPPSARPATTPGSAR